MSDQPNPDESVPNPDPKPVLPPEATGEGEKTSDEGEGDE